MTSEKGSSQPLLSMTGTQAAYKHTRGHSVSHTCRVLITGQHKERKHMDKWETEQGCILNHFHWMPEEPLALILIPSIQINIQFTIYSYTLLQKVCRLGEKKTKKYNRGWGEKSEFALKCRRRVEIEGWAAVVSDVMRTCHSRGHKGVSWAPQGFGSSGHTGDEGLHSRSEEVRVQNYVCEQNCFTVLVRAKFQKISLW